MYHPLSIVAGAVDSLACLVCVALLAHSVRLLRAHLARGGRGSAVHTSVSFRWFSVSLATLLRAAMVACAASAVICSAWTSVAPWLRMREDADASAALDSAAGRVCVVAAKLGPPLYACTKGFSYIFFFLKARTARPQVPLRWFERAVLLLTLQVFPFTLLAMWLSDGARSSLDGGCQFELPLWMVLCLACADAVLSLLYLYLFLEPLRTTSRANRRRTLLSPTQSSPATAATTATTAAVSRGDVLERLMRRNTASCVVSIACTLIALGGVTAGHVTQEPHALKMMWTCGAVDVLATNCVIAHLMWPSTRTGALSHEDRGHSNNALAPAAAAAPATVPRIGAYSPPFHARSRPRRAPGSVAWPTTAGVAVATASATTLVAPAPLASGVGRGVAPAAPCRARRLHSPASPSSNSNSSSNSSSVPTIRSLLALHGGTVTPTSPSSISGLPRLPRVHTNAPGSQTLFAPFRPPTCSPHAAPITPDT